MLKIKANIFKFSFAIKFREENLKIRKMRFWFWESLI